MFQGLRGITYKVPDVEKAKSWYIKSSSLAGSTVAFDYSSRWPEMAEAYGVKELIETMRSNYSGETTRFGIERGKIEAFLSDRGYKIINHFTAEDMERKYLTLRNGSLAGHVTGIFCLANAEVSD